VIPPPPDRRAVRILNQTYWSATGWLPTPAFPQPDDFVTAEAAGVMFRTKKLDHAAAVDWARRSIRTISARLVGDAFLASLSPRRPDLRSALASYHLARVLPEHKYEHSPVGYSADGKPLGSMCVVCGHVSREEKEYDLNVLNFERLKWGGVRFTNPVYIGFDLDQAAKWIELEPLPADLHLMSSLLSTVRELGRSDPAARPQHLEKAIAPLLGGNRDQRRVVLEVLAFCAVLQPRGRPSFAREWIRYVDRPDPPELKNDWKYPMHAWRGLDGVDDARLADVFPRLAGFAKH